MGSELVPERDIRLFDIKNVKGIKYTGRDYFAAQYRAYAKRFAALGIVGEGLAL